jgi:hypothetical protein
VEVEWKLKEVVEAGRSDKWKKAIKDVLSRK